MISHLRAALKFMALLIWMFLMLPVGTLTFLLFKRTHIKLVRFFYAGMCWIAGCRLVVQGEKPPNPQGVLFIGNHCSYFDIPVYGACVPIRFTPKDDIKRWPVIGQLAVLAMSLFIRRKTDAVMGQKEQIRAALDDRWNIMLFPEGTTNDGEHLKSFKSALFAAAEPPVTLQPVALVYSRIDGKLPRSGRRVDSIAWYGDMTLLPHLWALLGLKRIEATVIFTPPVGWQGDRKQTAAQCEQQIIQALSALAPTPESQISP